MNTRKSYIASVVPTILLCSMTAVPLLAQEQQLIEVRTVRLLSEEKAAQFDAMMESAIVALRSKGIGPIGVFEEVEPKSDEVLRIVVIPYPSAQAMVEYSGAYRDHRSEIMQAGRDYLLSEKSDPAFSRIESTLLQSFSAMPRLQIPEASSDDKRLFELRTYESYSEVKGLMKVAMFNRGEIDIFNRVGLNGLFYGRARIGHNLPCLVYMLVHDSEDAQAAAWQRFLKDPEWEALKRQDRYQDTVSKIVKQMLVALDYSEIK